MTSKKLIIGLALILTALIGAGQASAQNPPPDCSGQGVNTFGLVWENSTFSIDAALFQQRTATLYLFNPQEGDVRGWEIALDFDSSQLVMVGSTLFGDAVNVGQGNNYIVGLGGSLAPDATGAVALADFTFLPTAVNQFDIFGLPTNPASIPGSMAILSGPQSLLQAAYPVGGAGNPIANLNGPYLNYCDGPPNQAPVAQPDTDETLEDTPVTINVVLNDQDFDGTIVPSSVQIVGSSVNGGSFVHNGDGTVTFTPVPDFSGSDAINYTVADNQGAVSNQASILVNISPVDDPPVAVSDIGYTDEDTELLMNLADNDYDVDSVLNPGSIALGTPANGGSLTNNFDGTVLFTPAQDFNGFDTFSYTIEDESGLVSAAVTDTVYIASVNDPPVALPDSVTTDEDIPLTFNILANDYDIDGTLDAQSVFFTSAPGAGGSFIYNGDGTVTYIPATDYFGMDNITYRVPDDSEDLSNETTITVLINSVNDAPVALSESVTTDEDFTVGLDLTANDYDIDDGLDPTSVLIQDSPLNGGLLNNLDGTVNYTPNPDFFGMDVFSYTVADNQGLRSVAVVDTVFINSINDPPVAVPDTFTTNEDEAILINITANDYDIDNGLLLNFLQFAPQPVPLGVFQDNQDGTLTYTPPQNFFGVDQISYAVPDQDEALSNFVTVTVNVLSVNDAPIALADSASVVSGQEVIIDLLANDLDIDGTLDPASLNIVTPFAIGSSYVDNGDGTITYTSAPGFVGEDTATYLVSDNEGLVTIEGAAIVVTVLPGQNTTPVIGDIPQQVVDLGQPFPPLDLNSFVTDDQDPATLTWEVSGWNELSVVIADNQAIVQTADQAWFGSETFTFTVTDAGGLTDSAPVTFTVNNAFDLLVEILVDSEELYYAGTSDAALEDFDPQFDRVFSPLSNSLNFEVPYGMQDYAFVRHILDGQSNEVVDATSGVEAYPLPYYRYTPIPLAGEFCFHECVWNDSTEQFDCAFDCGYSISGMGTYSVRQIFQGADGDLELAAEEDAIGLLADVRSSFNWDVDVTQWDFHLARTNPDTGALDVTLQFDPAIMPSEGIGLQLLDQTTGEVVDLQANGLYTYQVPGSTTDFRNFSLLVGNTNQDMDGDGVPDAVDQCPTEDASFFDRDGDGCLDPVISGRHIEYWADGTLPLGYVIHEGGAPGIADGSDFTAVQEGFAAWSGIESTAITQTYLGNTADPVANAYDGINTVTFSDPEYIFPSGVIAVGLSTSYLEADYANGIRPGQIFDADMIFNPLMPLRTDTAGDPEGTHIKSVIVHEAGHMLGLSHSGVQSSTMFYVLPPDTTAASLEAEDRQAAFKAYYAQGSLVGASHLRGTVTDGLTGDPISGALVFAINSASGDTVASDFTLPADGSYHFVGLPDGSYNLAIHPLNGSSAIGYLYPDNINALIRATADVLFLPEFYDAAESSSDDPTVATPVAVMAGTTAIADFITNIDTTGPSIVAVSPAPGAVDVAIGAALLIRFDEAIDPTSLVGNFNFQAQSGGGLILGNASLVEDGATLAYVPTVNLEFNTVYLLELLSGVTDLFGNPMGTDFSLTFTTVNQPDVALNNLIPRKGVAGSILVINGDGFSTDPAGNLVNYGSDSWTVLEAEADQLVVQVPGTVLPSTENLVVQRVDSGLFSNPLSYTVLAPGQEAQGQESGAVDLFALPRQIQVAPDGDLVFVATDQGLAYTDVTDHQAPVQASLAVTGGLTGIAVTPDGQRVYGIGGTAGTLFRFGTDPVAELQSLPLGYSPRGVVIGPTGSRAYLATDFREIQIRNIDENSPGFLDQIGSLLAPEPNLLGPMATDPAGNYLLALDGAAQLLVFDLNTFALHAQIPVNSEARDVVVDPLGERAYVTDEAGTVSVVSLNSFTHLLDIPTGGELLGAAIDPMGSFLYAVNHQLNNLDVIDLRPESPTYRTISARVAQQTNPIDVAVSPDGLYAYSIVEADQRLAINTVGDGPMLASVSRRSGPIGARVVLSGVDLAGGTVSFNGTPAVVESGDANTLVVSVPPAATSGPLLVLGSEPGQISNAFEFEVLTASPAGGLRIASTLQPPGSPALTGAVAVSSTGRVATVGAQDGVVHLLDIDPASLDFNQFTGQTPALNGPVAELAMAPDGLGVYAVSAADSNVSFFNTNPGSAGFGGLIGTVNVAGIMPDHVAVSPDGRLVLVTETISRTAHLITWSTGTAVTAFLDADPGPAVFHPVGRVAYITTLSGEVLVLDTDPDSPGFGSELAFVVVGNTPTGLDFTPDGSQCQVLTGPGDGSGDRTLVTLDCTTPENPLLVSSLTLGSASAGMPEQLSLSPAGDRVLANIRDDGLLLIDLPGGEILTQADLLSDGAPLGFGFSPDGSRVFFATSGDSTVTTCDFNGQQEMRLVWGNGQTAQAGEDLNSSLRVRVVDPVSGEGLAGVPVTFSIDTSGKVHAASGEKVGGEDLLDATVIGSLPYSDTGSTVGFADDYDESCSQVSPGSPDVVYTFTADFTGGVAVDLCGSTFDTKLYVYTGSVTPGSPYACNDDYYDAASGCGDLVSRIEDMFVFEGTTYIIVVDGNGGAAGAYDLSVTRNYLSTPFGYFLTGNPDVVPTNLTVGSDALGFAEVQMNLGLNVGPRTVNVNSFGVEGSPVVFGQTAVEDPAEITFELLPGGFTPQAGSLDVAVSTVVRVVFSKAVDPASVTGGNFYLSADDGATAVACVTGFSLSNTSASLTPVDILEYGTPYTVVVGPGLVSADGDPLANPQNYIFNTALAPPAPALTGINPPGGPALAPVMLSGSGFNPDPLQNAVSFGGVAAAVTSVDPDFLLTKVPLGLLEGPVQVQVTVGGVTTNALSFSVFEPSGAGSDEVVIRVPAGAPVKSATVTPDGAFLYTVAPDADLVIPVDLFEFETTASIPVGDMPWAITAHPEGKLIYVANRMSGDVSIIDTDPASPTYQQAIGLIGVGLQPVDILVTPAGDRVLVANEESGDLAIIDSDSESASFNYVVNRVPVGSPAKSVSVTPDGARIYLGTDDGYIVIGSVDYGVVRRVPQGAAVKSVSVSPDGALLVLVDTEGGVSVVDIAQGSPTEDQVVARVPSGQAVKTATVSPDGALLYAVMEENDVINVYALNIDGGVGVVGDPDPRPVDDLILVTTLTAGENPQDVVFDPTDVTRFLVPNAGDQTISVFDDEVPVAIDETIGVLAGLIATDSEGPQAALSGARVNLFACETGELVLSLISGAEGTITAELPAGHYVASLVTPAEYTCEVEERSIELVQGQTYNCSWNLQERQHPVSRQSMAWWKNQLAIVQRGWGSAEVGPDAWCQHLDAVAAGTVGGGIDRPAFYQPPESGECQDKLAAAAELFNFNGVWNYQYRARQELLALMLNLSSARLSEQLIVSEDGRRVDEAVIFVHRLLADEETENDQLAWSVARSVNMDLMLASSVVPEGGDSDLYSPVVHRFHLDQNYPNPFNPECRIRFGVPRSGRVSLKIYDVSGRLVQTLVDENLTAGTYIRIWDGTDNRGLPAASGVYFYRMNTSSYVQTRKMLLMK